MKEVARYIYDNPDDQAAEVLVHGIHSEKGTFCQYVDGLDMRVKLKVCRLMDCDVINSNTLTLCFYYLIREKREEILHEFNGLFRK